MPRSTVIRASIVLATLLVGVAIAVGSPVDPDTASAATYTASPFTSRRLYVDPYSNAARDAGALATVDATSSAALTKIARQPQADWFTGSYSSVTLAAAVSARVTTITSAGAYPVLVAYNIPKRDCSSYSGGGATSATAYRAWIDALASGIGTRAAAVILEPDALAQLDCLSPVDQEARLGLLKYATQRLAGRASVAVYIDAGHASWITPSVMVTRLSKAGVAYARGFSLNVSNFGWTGDQIAYGRKIAPAVGWKRFIVDTSRNGAGPATGVVEPWCNPPGRALGAAPTAATGDALVDAYLWVKRPGESDGTCKGGPPAGQWWREYAIGLGLRS
jgi:endoglucanase